MLLLMFVDPEQIFQQVIVPVNQSHIAWPGARPVAEYAGRCLIVSAYWRQVSVDERLQDPSAFASISSRASSIGRQLREPQQPASDERRGRSIPIAKMHALVHKVIPRRAVFRKMIDKVARNLFSRLKHARLFRLPISNGEAVQSPGCPPRPGCIRGKALMRMGEHFLAGPGGVRKSQHTVCPLRRIKLLPIVAGVVM